ncbi:hypothetical protein PIIN_05402 [Serendipita indica DSM 11827]|uniref:SH3 domain-containing protein n=1 Tax=Serendipita indica (strain DSM 11827) TaxID=1109443 RepID=G4TJG6_SERID|nr:hypothetical protein PIIN_05402 [Serendipita indica DSM 11827]
MVLSIDVAYLVNTNQISEEDATFILSKVPLATDPSASTLQPSFQALSISEASSNTPPTNGIRYSPERIQIPVENVRDGRRPVPKPPVVNTFQARALWDYNLDNEHPEDLSFWHDDVIEVDERSTEKNADWWTGTVRGRSGLFPSTYVERITHMVPPTPPPMIIKGSRPSSEVSAPTYTPYRSTHAALNASTGLGGTSGGPNAIGLQPAQHDPAKRARYEHLKTTMVDSAAMGAGFGAGAAITGGLVRAIF